MFRSKIGRKGLLLLFLVVALYALSLVWYIIPLIRNTTYEMAETQAIALMDHVLDMVQLKQEQIESYRQHALDARKRELRHIASVGGGIIQFSYQRFQQGEFTEEQAKQEAIEQIRHLRYGNKDYLWISNFDSVLISHPDPQYHNADFSQRQDVYGNLIVPPMVEIARQQGEGYTSYWWSRLQSESPSEKLTYSTIFEPWQWAYGTGVYIDDIEEEVNRLRKELITTLRPLLAKMRIGETGYLYIFDDKLNMIIHPNPTLQGINFSDLLNPKTGQPIGEELLNLAKGASDRLNYLWDRPEEPGNYIYEKVGWVRHNDYFNWYIASSVYTDDLYRDSRYLTTRILLITFSISLLSLALGSLFLNKLLRPIDRLCRMTQQVREGDLKARSGIIRKDEIGILAREIDSMVAQLDGHVEELDAKVREKTQELHASYDQLADANDQVMESIQYACTIQQAMLPDEGMLAQLSAEHFVLWQPKDIIGGDLYWIRPCQQGFLFALMDCTGHGVPGAMMTIVATMILDRTVQDISTPQPAVILQHINREVRTFLGQDTQHSQSNDGLDIALCYIDAASQQLHFAGACLPLLVMTDGKLSEYKGDRHSLGYRSSNVDFTFREHVIPLKPGQQFYLFSDGYISQVGGENALPLGKKMLYRWIRDIRQQPFSAQQSILQQRLADYQGEQIQRDDITLIGFSTAWGQL